MGNKILIDNNIINNNIYTNTCTYMYTKYLISNIHVYPAKNSLINRTRH